MKPRFVTQMEEAFAVNQHVILTLNTEDRFYFPEGKIEPSNLNYFLASYFSRQGFRIAHYAPSLGVRELSPSGEISTAIRGLSSRNDPITVLNGLSSLLRNNKERWIILMLHAERIAPSHDTGASGSQDSVPSAEILHTLALDDGIASGPSRLVLVTFSGMPDDLIVRSRGYRLVEIDLPSQDERQAFIDFLEELSEAGCEQFGQLEEGLSREELARLTAGMPLSGIERAHRSAGHFKTPISREHIRLAKAHDIRNLARDLLEVSEPQEGFEGVAGLSSVKEYFTDLIPHIKAGGSGVPQAFLLQGVPGCGKSHLVRALSKELRWPLLELRNVRSPFVGQSEMNLEHVIRIVEQLQPAILFFDEIDQSIGQRGTGISGDSGTSERMLARIFTWLGSLHARGKLLFVGATNRPDILDAALLDRFGVSIPFLKPGGEELRELIPLLLKRFDRELEGIDEDEVVRIVGATLPTGRSIQELLIDAGLHADREEGAMGASMRKEHVIKAFRNQIAREDETEMEFIALVSLSLCSLQSLLPWNDCNGLRQGAEIPKNLLKRGVVGSDGRLDRGCLSEVIYEVKQKRHLERMMR
jgi:transitional endoplasmic reticulum ATPase